VTEVFYVDNTLSVLDKDSFLDVTFDFLHIHCGNVTDIIHDNRPFGTVVAHNPGADLALTKKAFDEVEH
jgi:hypothetical protein